MNNAQSIPNTFPRIRNKEKRYFLDLYCWNPIVKEIVYNPTETKGIMLPKLQFK